MPVAIIPARSGSKRVRDKNIALVSGRPLLSRVIELAHESGLFEDIVVSTDSPEYAEIAGAAGARIPGLRPAQLSDDTTPLRPVVQHALSSWFLNHKASAYVCCILPTAAGLSTTQLKAGLNLLDDSVDFVLPVISIDPRFLRGFLLDPKGERVHLFPEYITSRTQDLPKVFLDAGQFYWGTRAEWMRDINDPRSRVRLQELDSEIAIDVDSSDDLQRLEKVLAVRAQHNGGVDG